MSCVFRLSRHLTLVAAAAMVLLIFSSCAKKETSLAARRAAATARNAQLLESEAPTTVAAASPRPELVSERDVGTIVGRGLFSPLVRPESLSARGNAEWVQPDMEGIPVTFLDQGPGTPTPTQPGGPDGPQGPGDTGRPRLGEASSCQLAITGVVSDINGYRLLVRHIPSGQSRWVDVGEEAFGYKIEAITLRGALVSKEGRYYVLPLGQNAAKTEAAPAQTGAPNGAGESQNHAGESSEGDARFYGTWSGSFMDGRVPMTIRFGEDHSGSATVMGNTESFTWRAEGTTIHTTGGGGGPQSLSFRFENGDRDLVLSGGQMPGEIRLTKQ